MAKQKPPKILDVRPVQVLDPLPLKPGMYRLENDFENPWGDRRVQHDFWELKTWKAGTLFIVEPYKDTFLEKPLPMLMPIGRWRFFSNALPFTNRHKPVIDVICPLLVPVKEQTYETVFKLAKNGFDSVDEEDVLKHLFEKKTITLAQIQGAIKDIRAKREEHSKVLDEEVDKQ